MSHQHDLRHDLRRRRAACLLAAVLFLWLASGTRAAGQKPDPRDILARAAQNGERAIEALRGYGWFSELTIETVSPAEVVTGKFVHSTKVSPESEGRREERTLERRSTLPDGLRVNQRAAEELTEIYRFQITPETLDRYEFTHIGRERIDELNTYVFDAKPRAVPRRPGGERVFRGRVWIDDQDMAVVKVAGEALPSRLKQRAPKFETWFQNHDDYWFPAYSVADDAMEFDRHPMRVLVKLRLTGFTR